VQNIITLIEVAISQNWFKYNNQYYSQQENLAMGEPSSAILAEIFIQNLKHNEIHQILTKHSVLNYLKYVDNTLIIYYGTKTSIDIVLIEFNNLHKNLQFTIENNKEILGHSNN
jgi:hypothetical protein